MTANDTTLSYNCTCTDKGIPTWCDICKPRPPMKDQTDTAKDMDDDDCVGLSRDPAIQAEIDKILNEEAEPPMKEDLAGNKIVDSITTYGTGRSQVKPATKADMERMKHWGPQPGQPSTTPAVEDIHSLRATLESWEPVMKDMASAGACWKVLDEPCDPKFALCPPCRARKLMEAWNG